MRRRVAVMLVLLLAVPLSTAPGAARQDAGPVQIVMVTFRGCEEACRGFQDYITSTDLDAVVEVRDIAGDSSLLPGIVVDLEADPPDLLVTWGTTVTVGLLGTIDDDSGAVHDIPAVFMIVADPVGARVVESREASGRPLVAGTFNRVPEETQLRILAEYRPFRRLGLVYNDTELNAVLKADEIRGIAEAQGITVIERVIAVDAEGEPDPGDIVPAVADVVDRDIDFIYVGSSSFLLANADLFTGAAVARGVGVVTPYEAMVRESNALLSVATAYYGVGQLAGFQAYRILGEGATPGDLEIASLDRFRVLVNIDTARAIGLFPPMLMLRYAEIVGAPLTTP